MKVLLFFVCTLSHFAWAAALSSQELRQQIISHHLGQQPTWRALLQIKSGHAQIRDPNFFIKNTVKSAEEELLALADELTSANAQNSACRFPARTLWLQSRVDFLKIDMTPCKDLQDFLEKAPMERASIVFASENLSQPSSMMGHVFFKLSGKNAKGIEVDHAISFFTDVNDWNFIKLTFQSLVSGKKGFYQLTPYEQEKNYYLFLEQRNIWEYPLILTAFEKQLIHYYFYELKNISFTYLFSSFNCATLVRNILSVIHPEVLDIRSAWVTPLDVVRVVDQSGFSEHQTVTPASRWKIKALHEYLRPNRQTVSKIRRREFTDLTLDAPSDAKRFLLYELANAFNEYQFESDQISREQWSGARSLLKTQKETAIRDAQMDLSTYKKPSATIQDSQVFGGWRHYGTAATYSLGVLPATHFLADDNSQYQSESELRVGELVVEYEPRRGQFNLRSFILYSTLSLQPTDPFTGGLSGLFKLGIEPKLFSNLTYHRSAFISGGLGKTFRLLHDFDLSGLILGEIQSAQKSPLSLSPSLYAEMREILGLKSLIQISQEFRSAQTALLKSSFTQVLNTTNYSFGLQLWQNRRLSSGNQSVENGAELSVKAYL